MVKICDKIILSEKNDLNFIYVAIRYNMQNWLIYPYHKT